MASFETLKNGRVRASIWVNNLRESKTLPTPQKAKRWARDREAELSKQANIADPSRTFADLLNRYCDEISEKKRGARWERIRITRLTRDFPIFCAIKLVKLAREDIEQWIADRLKQVKPSSVNRDLNLISHAFTWGRRWRWMAHNPMQDLERPKNPPARFRRITEDEIQTMCEALGFLEGRPLRLKREFVAVAFLFAIETAMRAGEICRLTMADIDTDHKVAHLSQTKNGDERDVPLSERALELLALLPRPDSIDTPLFQMNAATLSAHFRKYRMNTSIQDLTFHDTRHEATTRLADKLHVLELAAVTGHRNINELMTYYNKTAAELADKISQKAPLKTSDPIEVNYAQLAQQLIKALQANGGGKIRLD